MQVSRKEIRSVLNNTRKIAGKQGTLAGRCGMEAALRGISPHHWLEMTFFSIDKKTS
jgi:hypothetical protein